MSHPVRWQKICEVRFYRLGNVLIAEKGLLQFIAHRLNDGQWEASWGFKKGRLRMPIGGDVLPTLRATIAYLRPEYERVRA